ncbi:MAG: biotin synthase [Pseudomonadota bacterium]|jgi:biotin synthase
MSVPHESTPPTVRHDWTVEEVRALHDLPLPDLLYRAQTAHRATFGDHTVQLCSLLSVKTGGCPEDCGYCPQAARYDTGVGRDGLMQVSDVLSAAATARAKGATRFCMGAAWRDVRDGPQFDRVLEMVRGVRELGMEACCTLGMLSAPQARRLKDAGLTAYNHNLDTSPEHYGNVITTRTYQQRLDTLQHVRDAGISVCCGGILGLGESVADRCALLVTLANQHPHPESVPVNTLVTVDGTPLADSPIVPTTDLVRVIATARILMPHARIRLSAGRVQRSEEAQLLCFLAGANSLFFGDTLLTTANNAYADDVAMLARSGLSPLTPTPAP